MKRFPYILSLVLLLSACNAPLRLEDVSGQLVHAEAGDTIVVADGTYGDVKLVWKANATSGNPVVVRAQNQGGVTITGASNLRVAGRGLTVCGFHFKDCHSPEGGIVEFRSGDSLASECRLTECVIEDCNPSKRQEAYDDVILYGRNDRLDHNTFTGKLNLGLVVGVNLNGEGSIENGHRIDHNLFLDRHVYGSNGAETIRVGTSQQAGKSSRTVIEDNVFERMDGEVEVISIKSSDNVVRNNLFLECQGVLAFRHGDRNLAEGNVFIGNGVRNTGGIRVVNSGHTITGNTFVGLRGTRFFSALALMDAVPNSLPNRYCLVDSVTISDNLFVDCSNIEFGTGRDEERTLPPQRVTFERNRIVSRDASSPIIAVDRMDGISFIDDKVELNSTSTDGLIPDAAAMLSGKGADWFVPSGAPAPSQGRTVNVADAGTLKSAVAGCNAGDVIVLADGEYLLSEPLKVSKPLTLRAADGAKPEVGYAGDKSGSMVVVCDGGTLSVEGISFSGSLAVGKAGVRHAITSDEGMIMPYSLHVGNCVFHDFGESGDVCIRGAQNTFADSVVVVGCTFRDLSGNAVDYGAEKDDIGRYDAEYVKIDECRFEHMLGIGINIYRGGSDESTPGPRVEISDCTFDDVCNRGRGSAMRLIGVQDLAVKGCSFVRSGLGGASIRLDETRWEKISLDNCKFTESGRIISNGNINARMK